MARPALTPKTSKFLTLASVCIVVAALYFAREVLVPLAMAMLVTFLLAPLCAKLERRRLGRIPSVLIVVVLALGVVGLIGWLISAQLKDLLDKLPSYRTEIIDRVHSIQSKLGGGPMAKATQTIADVAKEASSTTKPSAEDGASNGQGSPAGSAANPMAVVIAPNQPGEGAMKALEDAVYVLEPLAKTFVIVIFVVFMLLQREDLRDKLIRLMGHGRLTVTTQALDEAATKVSKYLLTQSIINGAFGFTIGIGLFLLGVPNAALWGLLSGLLRFIPYVGVWVSAAFPLLLAMVAPASWTPLPVLSTTGRPLVTLFLYLGAELITGNVLEPWLYGAHTGVSSVAILVAAVFWTWLWGSVGLLLSTPLTVCLVVIGKYVPHLGFLHVLLGDQPVLAPHERFYQRLLADDPEEATSLVRDYLKDHTLVDAYDTILIPTLHMAERDAAQETLSEERLEAIRSTVRELIEDMRDQKEMAEEKAAAAATAKQAATGEPAANNGEDAAPPVYRLPKDCTLNVLILPANDAADEIVALMLAHLLERRGYCAFPVSSDKLASEMVESVSKDQAQLVCVSALPPAAVTHARYLCKRLHAKFPELHMLIGLWASKGDLVRLKPRIACAGSVELASTLAQALEEIQQMSHGIMVRPAELTSEPGDESKQVARVS